MERGQWCCRNNREKVMGERGTHNEIRNSEWQSTVRKIKSIIIKSSIKMKTFHLKRNAQKQMKRRKMCDVSREETQHWNTDRCWVEKARGERTPAQASLLKNANKLRANEECVQAHVVGCFFFSPSELLLLAFLSPFARLYTSSVWMVCVFFWCLSCLRVARRVLPFLLLLVIVGGVFSLF